MTVAMWDWKGWRRGGARGSVGLRRWAHHTEPAVGLDCSVLREGLLGSCGWDEMVHAVSGQPQETRSRFDRCIRE